MLWMPYAAPLPNWLPLIQMDRVGGGWGIPGIWKQNFIKAKRLLGENFGCQSCTNVSSFVQSQAPIPGLYRWSNLDFLQPGPKDYSAFFADETTRNESALEQMTNLMFLSIYCILITIRCHQRKNAMINVKAISFRHDWICAAKVDEKWTTNVRSESKSSVTSALRREIWGNESFEL